MKQILSILFLFVSLATSGQTYTKELEKSAKEGDIYSQAIVGYCYLNGAGVKSNDKKAYKWLSSASKGGNGEAMYNLAIMYELCRVKDGSPDEAWVWYERAADRGNVNAQLKLAYNFKEQNNLPEAEKWFSQAAKYGHNVDAQYEYAKILLEKGHEIDAKPWFKKAANQGHKLAQKQYDKIDQKEREIAAAREAARRDSIARVEAEQRRLQAEEKRRQDSIDVATGVKNPPYSWLVRDCDDEKGWVERLCGLTRNDMFIYNGKPEPDGLDLAIYNKSEKAQEDKRFLSEHKNDKFAMTLSVYNWEFAADGFSFQRSAGIDYNDKALKDYLRTGTSPKILFPIKPNCVKKEEKYRWNYTFKCSDLDKLQRIRNEKDDIVILLIVNAGLYHPRNKNYSVLYSDDLLLTKPVGMYVVNEKKDEVLLDLSNNIRIATKAEFQKFDNRARLDYMANKKSPSSFKPYTITCTSCRGSGLFIWPSGRADSCKECGGRGYKVVK